MSIKRLEKKWLFQVPNLIASVMVMADQAFLANCIFVPGCLLMVFYNYKINDKPQQGYFMILWILAVIGVVWFLYKKWIMV